MTALLAVLTAVAAIAAWLLRWGVRRCAQRIEQGFDETAEKVHGLQRVALTGGLVMLVLYAAGTVLLIGAVASRHGKHGGVGWLALALAGYLALVVALVAVGRAVRPSLARVRDVPVKPRNRRRAMLLMLPVYCVIGIVYGLAFAFAPRNGVSRVVVFIVLYAAVLVTMQTVLAPLLAVALRSRRLPDGTAARLRALADRMGVRVRDIRAFEGREQKVANALQAGVLPGLRYVLVSDYLIDNVGDRELDAVVAHEFGHVRGRHLALKLVAVLAVWIGLELIYLGLRGAGGSGTVVVLLFLLIIAMPLALLLVNGLLGVRLERRADDAAVRAVGAPELAAALEKLAELNHTKRNTGRGWAIVTQHPGLDDRIARLRQAAKHPATHTPR